MLAIYINQSIKASKTSPMIAVCNLTIASVLVNSNLKNNKISLRPIVNLCILLVRGYRSYRVSILSKRQNRDNSKRSIQIDHQNNREILDYLEEIVK